MCFAAGLGSFAIMNPTNSQETRDQAQLRLRQIMLEANQAGVALVEGRSHQEISSMIEEVQDLVSLVGAVTSPGRMSTEVATGHLLRYLGEAVDFGAKDARGEPSVSIGRLWEKSRSALQSV